MAGKARIGVIDIGSNSLRLVVYDGLGRAPLPLLNEKALCGLGRGLGHTGRLDPEGVESALGHLVRFVALAEAAGVARLEVIATAAVRDAADGREFVAEAKRRCGVAVRILDGAAEGRLSAMGVLAGIPAADGVVGDLGGGSVELVPVDLGKVGVGATLPLGPLRLAEFGEDGKRVREAIDVHLGSVPWLRAYRGRTLYLVGGAWRALARIDMEQRGYPLHIIQGYTVARGDAEQILRLIGRLSKKSIEKITSVSKKRAESVPTGALVLSRLVETIHPDRIVFSAFGLREGLVFELLPEAQRAEDPLIAGCRALAGTSGRFGIAGEELFDWTTPLFADEPPRLRRLRLAAALVSDMGWASHPDYRADEAFRRTLHMPVAGLEHAERVFVAAAVHARYGGAEAAIQREPVMRLLADGDRATARAIGLALRLAYTVSGGSPNVVARYRLALQSTDLVATVPEGDPLWSGDTVQRRLEAVAKALDRRAVLRIAERRQAARG